MIALVPDRRPGAGGGHIARMDRLRRAFGRLNVKALETDLATAASCDAVVIDDYNVTDDELAELRRQVKILVLMDDSVEGRLQAPVDILVRSGGAGPYMHEPIGPYMHGPMLVLEGLSYAMVGDGKAVSTSEWRDQAVLLTVGKADAQMVTVRLIPHIIQCLPSGWRLRCVVGSSFSDQALSGVLSALADPRYAQSMELVMAPHTLDYDLPFAAVVICAGGVTLLEAAAFGTPSISFLLAENQRRQITAAVESDFTMFCGSPEEDGFGERVSGALRDLIDSPQRRQTMSLNGQSVIDGRGPDRVAEVILAESWCKDQAGA